MPSGPLTTLTPSDDSFRYCTRRRRKDERRGDETRRHRGHSLPFSCEHLDAEPRGRSCGALCPDACRHQTLSVPPYKHSSCKYYPCVVFCIHHLDFRTADKIIQDLFTAKFTPFLSRSGMDCTSTFSSFSSRQKVIRAPAVVLIVLA